MLFSLNSKPLRLMLLGIQATACLTMVTQLPAMARSVTPPAANADECTRAFHSFDTNGDACLNREEYIKSRMALVRFIKQPTPQELQQLESQWWADGLALDTNGDRRISLNEYCDHVSDAPVNQPQPIGEGPNPRELCRYGSWQSNVNMPVYFEEGNASRVVGTIYPGQAFTTLNGKRHRAPSGDVVILRPLTVRGTEFKETRHGFSAKRNAKVTILKLRRGATVQLVSQSADGYYLIRHDGKVYEVPCFWKDANGRRAAAELRDRSQNEWWVQVRTREGQQGWIRLVGDRAPVHPARRTYG